MRALVETATRHRRALLFLSWAVALLVLIKLDRYRTFLRPEFGVILEAAYVILLLFLVAELWRRNEAPLHGSLLLSPAILLLPILFVLNAQGVELDSYAFEKRSVGTPRVTSPETPPGQSASSTPPPVPVNAPSSPPATALEPPSTSHATTVTHLDLYNSSKQYEGKRVALVGMTYRNESARKEFGPQAVLVFRFVVACCAADAQPIAVVIERKRGQADFPDNTWVKVEGRFVTRKSRGDNVPVIEEAVVSPTPEPQSPYLY